MGVPTHRLEIRKSRLGHQWSNDYLIESPSMDDAQDMSELTLTFERSFHMNVVNFDYYRLSTMTPGDRIFRHVPLNVPGLAGAGGSDYLPLFNTLRFDMSTLDSDPCRKYYRLPLPEGLVTNEVIDAGTRTTINSAFSTWFAAWPDGTNVVSNIGHLVINGSCSAIVQMRQLRRHRRPKIIV